MACLSLFQLWNTRFSSPHMNRKHKLGGVHLYWETSQWLSIPGKLKYRLQDLSHASLSLHSFLGLCFCLWSFASSVCSDRLGPFPLVAAGLEHPRLFQCFLRKKHTDE